MTATTASAWPNPMGTDGFEFIEYAAPDPAAMGALFERMGFAAVARHRHKRVTLYRQGEINFILNAEPDSFAQRFARLRNLAGQAPPATATIVGHRYDIACHHLRDFLARNRIVFRWLDPTRPDLAGEAPPPREGDRYPLVLLPDGTRLVTPTLRELAERIARHSPLAVGAGESTFFVTEKLGFDN